jgi:hypothetical protein
MPYGVGSAHEELPTPINSPPTDELPAGFPQEINKVETAMNVKTIFLIFFIAFSR